MKTKTFLFLVALAAIMTSCDVYNRVLYTVENETGDSILLSYSYRVNYFDNQPSDTTIILKGNQKDTILVFGQTSPAVYDPESEGKMMYIINADALRLKDSTKIRKDMYLRNSWNFTKTGKNAATLELLIKEDDF